MYNAFSTIQQKILSSQSNNCQSHETSPFVLLNKCPNLPPKQGSSNQKLYSIGFKFLLALHRPSSAHKIFPYKILPLKSDQTLVLRQYPHTPVCTGTSSPRLPYVPYRTLQHPPMPPVKKYPIKPRLKHLDNEQT